MNQLEDDLHRVLQLARSQSQLNRHKAGSATKPRPGGSSRHHQSRNDALVVTRHRHESLHLSSGRLVNKKNLPPSTLLNVKLRGISAIYGLANAIPKLSDCSSKAARAQLETIPRQTSKESNSKPDHEEEEEEAILKAKLAARRDLYKRHYCGLHAAYGPTGTPKLESLLDAAFQSKAKMARHSALAIGASVLTSGNRIYASCTIESLHDAKYTICAERVALLKALGEEPGEVVVAMAVVSDHQQQKGVLPFPCGSCREFLAEFGDFPVYLMNGLGESEETRSFDLFPRARQVSTAKVVQQQSHQSNGKPDRAREHANSNNSKHLVGGDEDGDDGDLVEPPLIVKDWLTSHVLRWLRNDVELPQYVDIFKRSGIDGCTLLHLEDCDLQLLLGILQPLHRKRILLHIDRLKDRELLEHGINYGQLQDYLAVLDRDRITVVAELKATFDRLDQNKDGFLDFREVRQALSTLHCDATPQAVEALLRGKLLNGGEAGGDSEGRVSFPDFAAAFSSLAMQPASSRDEEERKRGQLQQQDQAKGWQLPVLDISGLRGTFNKADRNKTGTIDEQELIALFRALKGKEDKSTKSKKECAQKAREWFEAVDGDGDGHLSFAEFLIRYIQLTGVGITKLKAFFESSEPLESARLKPVDILKRALDSFFPDFSSAEVSVWYKHHLNSSLLRAVKAEEPKTDASEAQQQQSPPSSSEPAKLPTGTRNRSSLSISYADFVLAVFLFQDHMKERHQQVRELKGKMSNDAFVHKSRIVHLQQTGHVRMCPQTVDAATTSHSLAEIRQKQQQRHRDKQRNQKSESDGDEDEAKCNNDGEDDITALAKKQKRRLERQLARMDATFDRFAQAKAKKKNKCKPVSSRQHSRNHRNSDDDDGKQNDSNSEIDTQTTGNSCELNAMETAQAMTELGVACPRDQILRLLKDEGFGLADCIDRRDFRRLFQHFHAQSESVYGKFPAHRRPLTTISIWDEDAEHAKRIEHMAALLRGEYGKHRNRQDYDQYLLNGGDHRSGTSKAPSAHTRKPWKKEMVRFHTEKQSQKQRSGVQQFKRRRKKRDGKKEHEETKGDSSDENESSDGDSGDTSSDSSSRTESWRGGRHERARRRVSRSRSRDRSQSRHSTRRRQSRHSSSDSSSSTSFSSDEATKSEREEELHRHHHHHQSLLQKKRGFEIGDRVFACEAGNGTIIRLYRDYFVADVHFDSGTKAKNVDLAKLKRVDPFDEAHRMASTRLKSKAPVILKVGMRVAVSHKGTRTTRKGKITRCRMDGTFDLRLTDKLSGKQDEILKRVQAKHLRALGKPLVYAVGASVKVKQKHEYLRGKVGACRTDGTYDVQLRRTDKGAHNNSVLKRVDADLLSPDDDEDDEDGTDDEEDTSVTSRNNNKKAEKASTNKRRSTANDSDDEEKNNDEDKHEDFEPEFAKGDRIEARFQGKDAFYPGRIVRVLSDGTYDVVYDDGDEEARVKSHFIRAIATKTTTTTGSKTNSVRAATTRQQDDYGDDGFESD